MNLIGDPWIPVLDDRGQPRCVGLAKLFEQAHMLRDLSVRPTQRIALMRLLLAITYAAIEGPADEQAWETCRDQIQSRCGAYLAPRHNRFELFGPHPFLQVAAIEATNNAVVDKLDFGLSAGNNNTLFDHGGRPEGRPHTDSWLALHLLAYQCFSPGGTIGRTSWAGTTTSGNSEHAPAVEGSPLHTLIRGETLLDTLHLNLVPLSVLGRAIGEPVWELDLGRPDSTQIRQHEQSLLGRLVPLPRAILLSPNSPLMTLANGLRYPKLPEGRELSATVVVRGKGKEQRHAYLPISLNKHPWRELSSVLTLAHAREAGGALALRNLCNHDDNRSTVDLWVGGLVADKGKIIDEAEWNFSIPAGLVRDDAVRVYEAGTEIAQSNEQVLKQAVKAYASSMYLDDATGYRRDATTHYWSSLDQRHGELIETAASDAPLDGWRETTQRAARRAYEAACPHITPRQIKAFVLGRRSLGKLAGKSRKTKQEAQQ